MFLKFLATSPLSSAQPGLHACPPVVGQSEGEGGGGGGGLGSAGVGGSWQEAAISARCQGHGREACVVLTTLHGNVRAQLSDDPMT